MENNLINKVVLITGGTGSFGNAMVDKLVKTKVKEMRIISRDELKQGLMRDKYNDKRLKFYIGDVKDYKSIAYIFTGVDYVFHAAALKQVPSCEFFPIEAVKTNILGSDNVITACIEHKVKKAVFLSTDKAVYPINAMGLTKGLMEKNVIARSRHLQNDDTILCLTRYGNILASRGSVVPTFIKQAKSNKPLTITEPSMTRFIMTLEDAVDLVLFAFNDAKQGDTYIKKASSANIELIADAVINATNSKSQKIYIGTRHGEKQHEVLISSEEMQKAIDYGTYYKISADDRDLNYDKYFTKGNIRKKLISSFSSDNTEQLTIEELTTIISKVI